MLLPPKLPELREGDEDEPLRETLPELPVLREAELLELRDVLELREVLALLREDELLLDVVLEPLREALLPLFEELSLRFALA